MGATVETYSSLMSKGWAEDQKVFPSLKTGRHSRAVRPQSIHKLVPLLLVVESDRAQPADEPSESPSVLVREVRGEDRLGEAREDVGRRLGDSEEALLEPAREGGGGLSANVSDSASSRK